jgi:type II restriction enzyme
LWEVRTSMKLKDLIEMYEDKKKTFGDQAYKHISELFIEAKEKHKKDFLEHPTPQGDYEQSWKPFKGKNLEKLITYIIKDEIQSLGLKLVDGNKLEMTKTENLPRELNTVKRNLLVDFGEFGCHLPDVDIIAYDPKTLRVIAVISSKVTLRERIAQTGYWKIKLSRDKVTEHIKVYFITLDEDKTLTIKKPAKKGRAIVELDTDGSYVMSKAQVQESSKVKMFDKFIDDLKELIDANK